MTSILVTCNAGSTNTKLAVFDARTLERKGHLVTHSMAEGMEWLCSVGSLGQIAAIGHRIVHGGREHSRPVILNETILENLKRLIPLAPLHQPAALHLIEAVRKLYPHALHIGCFDTAFHHSMPEIERRLPLPSHFHDEGLLRYGFHGLSYQHIAGIMPDYTHAIVAHLGGGSSACALVNRKSIASTMGFSTLDGLMMSTRCGAMDAGAILYLLQEKGMNAEAVTALLYHDAGLKGVSGISGDMRELLASDSKEASNAVELYCYLAAKQIAGLLPALGGLNALIFTGGIGEHSVQVREKIIARLNFLGDFTVQVIPTDEEKVIAQSCSDIITARASA